MQSTIRVAVAAAVCLALSLAAASRQDRRSIPATPAAVHSAAVTAGGLVYASGVVGSGADIAAQTASAFGRLKAELVAAGTSLAKAVNVNVYLKRASDFDAMNAAYRPMFESDPPARTTIVADLPGDALIALSAVAVSSGGHRETMLPEGWMKSPRPYSYIVATDELVYLSGLVARRPIDDKAVPGSVALQTRTILTNAQALLRAAGLELDDVVSARVFITDDAAFGEMNEEYKRFFGVESPARSTLVAGLMGADASVEISLIASREEKHAIGAPMQPTLPISAAIRAGRRVFFSGVVGTTDQNLADTPAQAREALARLKATMAAADIGYGDIVDSTVYLSHLWQSEEIDKISREIFPKDPPARTLVSTSFVSRSAAVELLFTGYK